ncbi:MAG: hypothetical protein JNK47_19175 [Mesorhizobium sp.]|nr:hypothetical protein [Mesorhizobium sp.]MBL8579332.1 hypothetical protein [Mesorhizobium sp.]
MASYAAATFNNDGNAGFTLPCEDQPTRDHFAPWWDMETLAGNMQQARSIGRRVVLGGMLGGCLTLSGCDFLGFKNWQWNQRLILEVETPQGVVTGGSVVTIKVGSSPKWAPGMGAGGMSGRVAAGEASFVEIAPGRYLFALLDEGAEQIPYYTFFPAGDNDRERQATELETLRGVRHVPHDRLPLLVTFTDVNDPTTVQRVDPNNLAATFGAGFWLRRVMLEITDEKVTKGRLKTALPWMDGSKIDPALNEGRTETLRYPNESPRGYGTISTVNFVRA